MSLLLALFAPDASATAWDHHLAPAGPGTPAERARAVLGEGLELEQGAIVQVAGGHTVRFEQQHQGLPVLGASVAIRVRPDGSIPALAGALNPALSVSTTPALTLDQAAELGLWSDERLLGGRLVVLPQGSGQLAWELVAGSEHEPMLILVDAHSGALLRRDARLTRSLGRVYAENPVATPETSDLELIGLDSSEWLTGYSGALVIENYLSGDINWGTLSSAQELGPSEGEDFLYDPPADDGDFTDAFAQVNAYHHLAQARAFFEEDIGLDMSGEDWELQVIVNMGADGDPFDNAFFSPTESMGGGFDAPNLIGIGQGSTTDFAVDADVFVHEFVHYASNVAVGYNQGQLYANSFGLSPWAGSMDEGIADYFAASIFEDPVIGEASLASLGAERDLSETGLSCPADITGEVHEDGKLVGSTAWSLREHYGAELSDQLVWGALSLMTSDSDFQDFSEALTTVAADLQAAGELDEVDFIAETLAANGMDQCSQVQDLDLEPLVMQVWGLDLLASSFGLDCATVASFGGKLQSFFHFSATVPEGATEFSFQVEVQPESSGELGWQLFMRQGEPVELETGLLLPEPSVYDLSSEILTDEVGAVEVDELEPGTTWYGVIMSQSCPNTRVTISAESDGENQDTADTGLDDTDPVSEGEGEAVEAGACGCASGAVGGAWLLPLALLATRRRR